MGHERILMTDVKTVKELVEYAISKKLTYLKVGDVEFTITPDSWQPEPIKYEELPTEELAKTFKQKYEDEKREYLKELFNQK